MTRPPTHSLVYNHNFNHNIFSHPKSFDSVLSELRAGLELTSSLLAPPSHLASRISLPKLSSPPLSPNP
jgi:hypothetical protein